MMEMSNQVDHVEWERVKIFNEVGLWVFGAFGFLCLCVFASFLSKSIASTLQSTSYDWQLRPYTIYHM
jgi:hypothetical protein